MPGHLGFTGTRNGLDRRQAIALSRKLNQLRDLGYEWFHHGDCIGADEDAHYRAKSEGFKTHGHPPINDTYRAHCRFDKVEAPVSFRERNAAIVDRCDILIVCPKSAAFPDVTRGGTLMTYNIAKAEHKPTCIIYPDGSMRMEEH